MASVAEDSRSAIAGPSSMGRIMLCSSRPNAAAIGPSEEVFAPIFVDEDEESNISCNFCGLVSAIFVTAFATTSPHWPSIHEPAILYSSFYESQYIS